MTIAIIISAHGSVSEQLLRTTEMIIGKQDNVAWVDLISTENTDDLIKKYNQQLSKLNTSSGVLFVVDTWGGTPFNAAQKIILNQSKYDIITGMNIPMLIEIFIERDNIKTIQKLAHVALQAGLSSIKLVKNTLNYDEHVNQQELKKNKLINDNNTTLFNNNPNQKHMTICVARIDDRLIHGQVVTRWAKEYTINRIIVVNDDVAKDIIRKNLLTQVTPPGITAHVVNIDKAIRVYNNIKYAQDTVIMLFTNPTDVVRLIEGGIPISSVNIGGMSFSPGKKQINSTISVNLTDIAAFKRLNQLGIKLEVRKVPSDSQVNLMKLIKNM